MLSFDSDTMGGLVKPKAEVHEGGEFPGAVQTLVLDLPPEKVEMVKRWERECPEVFSQVLWTALEGGGERARDRIMQVAKLT